MAHEGDAEVRRLRDELAACRRELDQYRELEYADGFAAFSQRWPGTLDEEFNTFVEHTSEAYKSDRTYVLRQRADYAAAAFVVQVDYGAGGKCDLVARNKITDAATGAGFQHVDSNGSRSAFDFVPGAWSRFCRIVGAAARANNIELKRVLLCHAPLGLSFGYPEDGYPIG